MIIIFKQVEEIRKENTQLNQTDFAREIGLPYRSYQERLSKERPNWKFTEIVKASQFNNGKIRVETDDGVYDCIIKCVE